MGRMRKINNMLKMNIGSMGDLNVMVIILHFLIPFLITFFEITFWETLITGENTTLENGNIVTYILLANLFQEQFNIYTPATTSLWEGSIIKYYTRPLGILAQLICETVGKKWIVKWLIYSIPTAVIAKLIGVRISPYDMSHFFFFLISMVLTIIIGFEIDIMFSSLAKKLKNGCWAAIQIRNAIIIVLSGQLIPFQVLPNNLRRIMEILPFSSIASAPLTIYIGGDFVKRILLQCFWGGVLGLCSYIVFTRSEERMISFGG